MLIKSEYQRVSVFELHKGRGLITDEIGLHEKIDFFYVKRSHKVSESDF